MSINAMFNRRVLLLSREKLADVLASLQDAMPTGEVIDVEIDRVKRLIELAIREPKVPVDDSRICKIHHLQMAKREGAYGAFWSCPARTNGAWCSYRPPKR
jgi:hypothetical protein